MLRVRFSVLICGTWFINGLLGAQLNLPSDRQTPDEELLKLQRLSPARVAGTGTIYPRSESPVPLLPARYLRQVPIQTVTPPCTSVGTQTEISTISPRTPGGVTPALPIPTTEPSASELIFKTALWFVLMQHDS